MEKISYAVIIKFTDGSVKSLERVENVYTTIDHPGYYKIDFHSGDGMFVTMAHVLYIKAQKQS